MKRPASLLTALLYYLPVLSSGADRSLLDRVLPLLAPDDRSKVVCIDLQGRMTATDPNAPKEIWRAPHTPGKRYMYRTGETFTLRRVPQRPQPLLVIPSNGLSLSQVLLRFEEEFGSNSGPYRRVLSRLPAPGKGGYSYLSAGVHLPGSIDIAEEGTDSACVYCGGWGGHRGALDAGFVHSKAHHNWAFFVRREIPVLGDPALTGETFSLTQRFKEDQDVRLTLSVPLDDTVAVNATGLGEHGEPINFTVAVALDPEFEWRADGKANILKRMTTIAQDHQNFALNERIVGVHWFAPKGENGPCRIGWNWRNNHDWRANDSASERSLGIYENWPASYRGAKVVYVDTVSPGEETDGISLAGAQHTPSRPSGGPLEHKHG
jgi:hypothetical protein